MVTRMLVTESPDRGFCANAGLGLESAEVLGL